MVGQSKDSWKERNLNLGKRTPNSALETAPPLARKGRGWGQQLRLQFKSTLSSPRHRAPNGEEGTVLKAHCIMKTAINCKEASIGNPDNQATLPSQPGRTTGGY